MLYIMYEFHNKINKIHWLVFIVEKAMKPQKLRVIEGVLIKKDIEIMEDRCCLFLDSADSVPIEPIPEYTAREELDDNKRWRVVQLGDKSYRIDMEAIDPYKKVLSHGGQS